MRQISRGKFDRLPRATARSTTSALDGYGLRDQAPARPAPYASYLVLVHRLASLLHASFRPRLATTPLRFAITSPPSGCEEDFHLLAVEHARHTLERARLEPCPKVCVETSASAPEGTGSAVPIAISFLWCHPERSEADRAASGLTKSRDLLFSAHRNAAGEPQVPPRGLKSLVGMTISKGKLPHDRNRSLKNSAFRLLLIPGDLFQRPLVSNSGALRWPLAAAGERFSVAYAGLASKLRIRTRLYAVAASRNIQSTRRRPRNLVRLIPAEALIQPNTCSTNFRFC